MDWPKLLRSFPKGGEPPLLAELARQVPRSGGGPTARRQDQLLKQLEQAQAGQRGELLVAYLQAQAMRVLGIPPDQVPDPRQPLTELGLDSLMGVELKNRLTVELGVEVPLERFIEAATVAQLAEMLNEQLALARLVPAAPPADEIHEDMEELTL
jgi:acyl carrier protein